jgi:metal-responsive CopG/Arc/MetJ family transcriptional regulator
MVAKALPKRPMGRPVTVGGTEFISLRLPEALVKTIDAWAAKTGVSRSEAMRQLIETGLKRSR